MRMNTNYVKIVIAISVLWTFIMVVYLGLPDEPRARIISLDQYYHASVHSTSHDHSELILSVTLKNYDNDNNISKEMQEEQFSLNKIPEIDLEKLSVVQDQQELVILLHFCITCLLFQITSLWEIQ